MYIWRWNESYSAALFDPMNYSPPGSYIHGISQAKIEYWSGLLFPSPIVDFFKSHLNFGNYTNVFIWEWQKQSRLYSQINCLNFILWLVFLFRLGISNFFPDLEVTFSFFLSYCFISVCSVTLLFYKILLEKMSLFALEH